MRTVLLALAALTACGRLGFDAHDEACTDGPCTADPACTDPASTVACDDGDACTVGDRCALGVCAPGAATGCPAAVQPIFRSVGATTTALASSAGTLAITGTTATFTAPLPDRVGVGDALEYDSDGDGAVDALAFIHRRLSSQVYAVRTSTGATPVVTSASTTWSVFRAYRTLADAVDRYAGGTRNPGITIAFDGYAGGHDLVAGGEQWNVACYDDGATDDAGVEICDTSYTRACSPVAGVVGLGGSWATDANHFLRIFTPTRLDEAGTSQRHHGTWGTGYRRTQGIIMYQGFVRLDGLSIQRSTNGNGRTYYVETEGHGGEVWISNSFGWNSITGASKVYDIWDTGVAALGPTYTIYKLWNDIAYNETIGDTRSGFYLNSNRAEAYVYNSTAYVKGGGAFYQSSGSHATLKNCLGSSEANPAFAADDGFQLVTSSASNDASLNGIANGSANSFNQVIAFANAAGVDFHLSASASPQIRRAAIDLTADPTLAFTDDIDGDPRPAGAWDLGADQTP